MKNGTYAWVTIDDVGEPEIAQYFDGKWYTCGDEQGWCASRVGTVRVIKKRRRL